LRKAIPSTGEAVPAVGLGSWITFNVGNDPRLRAECRAVMAAFFEQGGGMIDSSPMYGSAQAVIGDSLRALGAPPGLFSADKVWTSSADGGPGQIRETAALWGVAEFDLLQVHNLVRWEEHLETLFAMKADGRLRYVGITTSHGRQHGEFEEVMRTQPLDFVQLTYNIADREAERRLLPLAAEKGIGVICNRPFRRGALPDRLEGKPLPGWAAEIGVETWPAFLLKFIISHPAVTTAIPATRQVAHLLENKAAEHGPMPDAATRRRMADYFRSL
jgi:diketogulonate reductase-like aldo/keto reductase